MLNSQEIRALEHCFAGITDPRRSEGPRDRLPVMLGIAAGATLCCTEDCKAMPDWANALGRKARERFGCGRENGLIEGKHYVLDIFHADGHYERFPALAAALARQAIAPRPEARHAVTDWLMLADV